MADRNARMTATHLAWQFSLEKVRKTIENFLKDQEINKITDISEHMESSIEYRQP